MPFIEGQAVQDLKQELLEAFVKAETLTDEQYHHFIYNYLIYVNGRDVIGKLNIMYDSSLIGTYTNMNTMPYKKDEPSLISFNPEKKSLFAFQGFKAFFDAIDSLEHEMAHNFDQKYLINPYKKFVCENGKIISFPCCNKIIFKEIFKNSSVKYIAMLWADMSYFSSHSEQFARKTAYKNTTRFFRDMINFAKSINLPDNKTNQIVCGFKEYEEKVLKDEEEFMHKSHLTFSNKGKIAGKNLADLKKEWNNFIDKLCTDDLQSLEYLNEDQIEDIQASLSVIIDLCNYKTIFNQANFDKLFACQIGKEQLNLDLLLRIICQKNNTKSRLQLNQLKHIAKVRKQEECLKAICKKLFTKPKEVDEISIKFIN